MVATCVQVLQRLVVHGVVGELHVLGHGAVNKPRDVSVELVAEGVEVLAVGLVVDAFFARPLHGEAGDVARNQLLG